MSTYSSNLTRLGLCCAILLTGGFAACANAEEYVKSYSVGGRANVHVHAQYGAVSVTTSDDTKVEFDVRYDKRDWASALPIDSRQDGNVVELTALLDPQSWWGWGHFSNRRLSIEVRMPKNADLQLETSNGAVDVSSLNGNISIHTSNGRIRAEQLSGMIDVGSSNAEITLDSLTGTVKVRTSNGAISATHLDGKCELSTSNSWIQATGRFESLDITSNNGGVVARAESGSRMSAGWNIRTTNAGVDLSLPTDLKANLDAGTSNGGVALDLPVTMQGYQSGTQLRGVLNGGGPELSVHTSNGRIRVRGI